MFTSTQLTEKNECEIKNKNKQPKKHETKTNSVMRCNFSVEMCKFLIIYDTNERDCSCVMWQSVTVFS